MGFALLVTSSWMVNLYVRYCDYVKDNYYGYKCGHNEGHFLILPIFGFITMVTWVRGYVATYLYMHVHTYVSLDMNTYNI